MRAYIMHANYKIQSGGCRIIFWIQCVRFRPKENEKYKFASKDFFDFNFQTSNFTKMNTFAIIRMINTVRNIERNLRKLPFN